MGFGGWVALKKIGTEWFFSFLKLIKFSDNFCILLIMVKFWEKIGVQGEEVAVLRNICHFHSAL